MPKRPLKQSELLQLILAKVTDIEHRLSGHDKRFDSHDQKFDHIDQKFDHIDQRFDHIDQRFAKMDQRFDKMDRRFDKMDRRFDKMDQRFDKTDQRFDKMDQRFDQLTEFVGEQAVRLTETNELLLQTRIEMQAGFTDAKIELAGAEQRLTKRINNLEKRIEQVQQTHNEDIHVHSRLILSQGRKITRLQKMFSST